MNRPRFFWLVPALALLLGCLLYLRAPSMLEALGLGEVAVAPLWWHRASLTLVWLAGAGVLSQLIRTLVLDGLVASAIGGPVPGVLKAIVTVIVFLVALTGIVGAVFGYSVTAFLATLGAAGVILGFGLRNLVSDVFTGLAINVDRSFVIGDWVEVRDGMDTVLAQVDEIGWRCTSVTTEEKTTIVIPNGQLGVERLVNVTRPHAMTRFETTVIVDFSVPARRVKRVLLGALRVLEEQPGFETGKKPEALVSETTAQGVEYLLRYWIWPWNPVSPTRARDMVLQSVLEHFEQAGIALAYPRTDLYTARLERRQFGGNPGDIGELLTRIPLFAEFEQRDFEDLRSDMRRRDVPARGTVMRQGEQGDTLFVLTEGVLEVFVDIEGRDEPVGKLTPGACFGEMSLLTGERRSATIRALTDSIVHEFGKAPFSRIMERRPEVAEHLARLLAERRSGEARVLSAHEAREREREAQGFARQIVSRMRSFLDVRRPD